MEGLIHNFLPREENNEWSLKLAGTPGLCTKDKYQETFKIFSISCMRFESPEIDMSASYS